MKTILTLAALFAVMIHSHAGQWFYVQGNDTTLQTGATPVVTNTFTLTTNNNLTIITTVNLIYDQAGGGPSFNTRLNGNIVNAGTFALEYVTVNPDPVTLADSRTVSASNGLQTIVLTKVAGGGVGHSVSLPRYSVLVYADNEFGPSDQRVLTELAGVASNLQAQITTVSNQLVLAQDQITTTSNALQTQIISLSNSLETTQGQVTTNTSDIAALRASLTALTAQYNTLSNTLANIPSITNGLATTAQLNDLQGRVGDLDNKLNKRTGGVLGGSMWNDVITFMGAGTGALGLGNSLFNPGKAPIFNSENIPEGEARPGYYE